jgi:hypothetical protein
MLGGIGQGAVQVSTAHAQPTLSGAYEIRVKLPVTGSAGPTVPLDAICPLVKIEISTVKSRTCAYNGKSFVKKIYTVVKSQTGLPGTYDRATNSCVIQGSIRFGQYRVKAFFQTAPDQVPWNPPLDKLESISASHPLLTVPLRGSASLELTLQRSIVVETVYPFC